MKSRLILASNSPRRRELLANCGAAFEVSVSGVPEERLPDESPRAMAERLALTKALAVAEKNPDAWVIGADTDVCIDSEILGKPADAADAVRLLKKIAGRTHSVWGAFSLVRLSASVRHVEAHETRVTMAAMTDRQVADYVATGDPLDKAGAYGAQGLGAQYISSIHGSYTNVVGLDICALVRAMDRLGIEWRE